MCKSVQFRWLPQNTSSIQLLSHTWAVAQASSPISFPQLFCVDEDLAASLNWSQFLKGKKTQTSGYALTLDIKSMAHSVSGIWIGWQLLINAENSPTGLSKRWRKQHGGDGISRPSQDYLHNCPKWTFSFYVPCIHSALKHKNSL